MRRSSYPPPCFSRDPGWQWIKDPCDSIQSLSFSDEVIEPFPLCPGFPRSNDLIVPETEVLGIGLKRKSLVFRIRDRGFYPFKFFEDFYRHCIKKSGHAVTPTGEVTVLDCTGHIEETFAYFRSPLSMPFTWARGEMNCTPLIKIITALPDRVIHAFPTGAASAFFITSDMS